MRTNGRPSITGSAEEAKIRAPARRAASAVHDAALPGNVGRPDRARAGGGNRSTARLARPFTSARPSR